MSISTQLDAQIVKNQLLLAIDFGTKVTGLAQFRLGSDPFPLSRGRLIVSSKSELIKSIKRICSEDEVDHIVLGLPKYTDGKESQMSDQVKDFAKGLSEEISLPIHFQDETLSTFEAMERMKNSPLYHFRVDKKKIDELSAIIILEEFINTLEIN